MKYDGVAPEALAQRWGTDSCIVLDQVESTQDVLHEMAEQGSPARSIVLADHQLRGRGRLCRPWVSSPGRSILLSYLSRPRNPQAASVTSLRVGLAVLDALSTFDLDPMLKWPNDVMLDDRKAAGILCEARWRHDELSWVAIGIGLNVVGPVPEAVADRAVALSDIRPGIDRLGVLDVLIPRLHTLPLGPALSEAELSRLRERDWLANKTIVKPVLGRACGVNEDGALKIQTEEGVLTIMGGEVVPA